MLSLSPSKLVSNLYSNSSRHQVDWNLPQPSPITAPFLSSVSEQSITLDAPGLLCFSCQVHIGFAISFDLSVVDDSFSSTAFFTASSSLCTNVSLTQSTGRRVLLTTVLHKSSCLGSKGPKSMARNRTWDPSDLEAFLWSSKGVALIPAPLPYALFLDTQKGCSGVSCMLMMQTMSHNCTISGKWSHYFT